MKMKSFTTSLCAALLCFTLAFQSCKDNPTEDLTKINQSPEADLENTQETNQQLINPPFQDLGVAYQQFMVKANQPQSLALDNGTQIDIPENAFVYESGEPVEDDVLLEYREFHDAADLITSGIPMVVDKGNGEEGHMKTAGMFEIKGSANNRNVKIAPGKSLDVNMASKINNDEAYDLWYLDPATNNWENRGPSVAKSNKNKAAIAAKMKEGKPVEPVKPVAYAKAKPVLNFEINYDAFPELKNMKGILWQHTGANSAQDPINNKWIFKETWDFVALEKGGAANSYKMVLSNADKKYETTVSPSRKGADLEAALAAYDQQLASYKSNLMTYEEQANALAQQVDYNRSFSIQQMGIHNCDLIIRWPGAMAFEADIDLGENVLPVIKKQTVVYLITGDGRSVIRYAGLSGLKNFTFSQLRDNCLVAVLPGNKIATFSQDDFKKNRKDLNAADGKRYTFKMKMEEKPMESLADIQELIHKIS